MMFNFKLASTVVIASAIAGSALALGFGTTAVVNGNSYTINGGLGANGIGVTQIGNTISFALPNGVAINSQKTLTLEYFVQATPGFVLNGINQIAGNGSATNQGVVKIDTSFAGAVNEVAPSIVYGAGSAFPAVPYSFTSQPVQWNKVTTVINLNAANGGLAKVSTYSANYTEVVPEPVSILAIGAGVAGLVARKKRKSA
jgi:hypothetical protein